MSLRPSKRLDHVFVIPAYGSARHLGDCIESILNQTAGIPRIMIGTSTPSAHLSGVATRFGIKLLANPVRADIATDWNFVLNAATSQYVTIAHQDDLYDARYVEAMAQLAARHPEMMLAFSDYREHTEQGTRSLNLNLRIKRLLCARGFGRRTAICNPDDKIRLLNLGNPICCPSVMLNRARVPDFEFSSKFKTNLDWDAWLRLAGCSGEFVYAREALVSKRVHPASETSVTIANRIRECEDRLMFARLWPKPAAALIARVYSLGYFSNRV